MSKREERREKFRIIGRAITAIGERDYHSGNKIQGEWKPTACVEPGKEKPISGGPQLRTLQFDRGE